MSNNPSFRLRIIADSESAKAAALRSAVGHANAEEFLGHSPGTLCIAGAKPSTDGFEVQLVAKETGWHAEKTDFGKLLGGAMVE